MMHRNTTSNIEIQKIRTLTTTTAARMLARTRMGIATFTPSDAQFAEPMDMNVWTAHQWRQFITRRRNSSPVNTVREIERYHYPL